MNRLYRPIVALIALSSIYAQAQQTAAPIAYVGNDTATSAADGNLRPVVGVHNIQVVRSNRTAAPHADGLTDTYLHQPMLAYWRGQFFLEYLSGPRDEHEAPCTTSLTTSRDGVHWEKPRLVFPAFKLPDGTETIAHQRMGFYVAKPATEPAKDVQGSTFKVQGSQATNAAPVTLNFEPGTLNPSAADGRLLVLAFYGKAPSPNDGTGIGRAVREIIADKSAPNGYLFGPIYFLRYNRTKARPIWDESNTPCPFYKKSPDAGFVAACDALLANKLMTQQWWEEDQLTTEKGFYPAMGKAMSFTHRPDGAVIAVWKNALTAISTDEGKTWSPKQFAPNLPNNASKYWIQRTADNRYALVFNPTNRLRQPLALLTSDDCRDFDGLLAVHGETPDQRFSGAYKNPGPQYVRGIIEGNGTPPARDISGGALGEPALPDIWLTYSVNKEDIWVARVPVPINAKVSATPIREIFDDLAIGEMPTTWNLYCPTWASIRVVEVGKARATNKYYIKPNRALELRDAEPHDYARAIRVFPETHGVKVSLHVLARQTTGRLEIDLVSARGSRPVRIAFCEDGRIRGCHEGIWQDAGAYTADKWQNLVLEIPPGATQDRCQVLINGKPAFSRPLMFTEPAETVERLSLRTGVYRERGYGGLDLKNVDEKSPEISFLIDDVEITPIAK